MQHNLKLWFIGERINEKTENRKTFLDIAATLT